MAYDLVTGDTLPVLKVAVKDHAGADFNLTGMTAKFRWEGEDGALVQKTASIAGNVASYQFAAGEIFAPSMKIELEITNADGKIITVTDIISLSVREQIG